MELIQEKLDKDIFIDIVISEDELDAVSLGEMISLEFYIGKERINLGIRLPTAGEKYAPQERKKSKSHK